MALVPRSEPATTLVNAAKADALLAKLDAMEELAEVCETEVIPAMRGRLAARYATLIGVEPSLRGELRARLEIIRVSGDRSVRDIIEELHQSNRG